MADRDLQDILSSGELGGAYFKSTLTVEIDGSTQLNNKGVRFNKTESNIYPASDTQSLVFGGDANFSTITTNTLIKCAIAPADVGDLTNKEYVDGAIAKVADDVASINKETFDIFEYSGTTGSRLSRTEIQNICTEKFGSLPSEDVKFTVITDDNYCFIIIYLASRDIFVYEKLTVR